MPKIRKLDYTDEICKVTTVRGFNVQRLIGVINHVLTIADCLSLCMKRSDCLSINYVLDDPDSVGVRNVFTGRGSCFLSSGNIQHLNRLHSLDNSIYASFVCDYKKPDFIKTTLTRNKPPKQCGVLALNHPEQQPRGSSRNKRIIGGSKAPPLSQPWLGVVLMNTRSECGISLIAKDKLESATLFGLSAAHCFSSERSASQLPTETFGFLFGVHDSRYPSPGSVYRRAAQIILHPNYDFVTNENDITLVVFDGEIRLNDYVRPICLPTALDDPPAGTACYVCGFGVEGINVEGYTPKYAVTPSCIATKLLVDDSKSREVLTQYTSLVGHLKYKGAFEGDSGGPVSCLAENKFTLFGVISTLSAQGFDATSAENVFTRVPFHADWIQKNIREKTDEMSALLSASPFDKKSNCFPYCVRL